MACSPSPRRPRPPHGSRAPPLSCLHLGFCPPSWWHPARAQPCTGRVSQCRRPLRRCPPSQGSWLCSGSRCRRGEGTTGGCGKRCLGPSGGRPPGHIYAYDGQQLVRAAALIVKPQCQGVPHQDHREDWKHSLHGWHSKRGRRREEKRSMNIIIGNELHVFKPAMLV